MNLDKFPDGIHLVGVGKDESQIAGQLTKVDRLSGGLVPPFYETLIIDSMI